MTSKENRLTLQQINAKITLICDNTRELRKQIEINEAELKSLAEMQAEITLNDIKEK